MTGSEAYLFDLDDSGQFSPLYDSSASEFSVEFRLGILYRPMRSIVRMIVSLTDLTTKGREFELQFGIHVQRTYGDYSGEYFGGDRTKAVAFTPKAARKDVLDLILLGISCLLREVDPAAILMRTSVAALPVEAFAKYDRIEDLLVKENGYVLEDKDVYDDWHTYWIFSKLPASNSTGQQGNEGHDG